MAFTNGTATGSLDLMTKLQAWVIGTLGWSSLKWDSGNGEMIVSGPGATSQPVIVRAAMPNLTDLSKSWQLGGAVNYNSALPWLSNNGALQSPVFFALGAAAITYWFYGNSRHIKVVAKVGTTYMAMYLGFFLPLGLPTEYPYPLYIGGTGNAANTALSVTSSQFRNFWDPGFAYAKDETLSWTLVQNHGVATSADFPTGNNAGHHTFPYVDSYYASVAAGGSGAQTYTDFNGSATAGFNFIERIVANKYGEFPIWPIEIRPNQGYDRGSLDGVFCIPGGGILTPEQTVTSGTRTFRVFPNIFRSAGKHYAAFEEV